MIHQNSKIVTEKGSGNPERPRRGNDEGLSDDEESSGNERSIRFRKKSLPRLITKGSLVSAKFVVSGQLGEI